MKITTTFLQTPACPILKKHCEEIQTILEKIIPQNEIPSLNQRIPLVNWQECKTVPGGFSVYLLCLSSNNVEISSFFFDMISRWLIPGKQLNVLSSKNMNFRLQIRDRAEINATPLEIYYIAELIIEVTSDQELWEIKKNIGSIAKEICLGVTSGDHARHILEAKGLSKEQKTTLIHESVVRMMRKRPKDIEPDIFNEIQRFLLSCDDEFKKIRDVRHMTRIIYFHHLFKRILGREISALPELRHLKLKMLHTHLRFPFGEKKVLGLVIGVAFKKDYELFEERHVIKAIQRFIPNVEAVQRSFYAYQETTDSIRLLYLEVEKENREPFTLTEIKQLSRRLPNELKASIEDLMRSIFMPRNEEEVFRNIMTLSREFRYIRDLPQVIISLKKQTEQTLTFNVILVRLIQKSSISLQELSKRFSTDIVYIPDQVKIVGNLRKRYSKEANVFSLEIKKESFLRLDHSVDLYKARGFIVAAIENILGEVRDYNGGLIYKQNQLLSSVKNLLSQKEAQHEFLLENFFYSLTPVVMQSLLQPKSIIAFFQLFLELLHDEEPKRERYLSKSYQEDHNCYFIIRSEDSSFVKEMREAIGNLEMDSLKLASTFVTVHGFSYLGYYYKDDNREKCTSFVSTLELALMRWSSQKKNDQYLNISLPKASFSLDPRIGMDNTSAIVLTMLYEGLMRTGNDGLLTFGVAEHVDISSDYKQYVFKLRQSQWSNGKKVTAQDFEYAWKKILDPSFNTLYAYLFYEIKNARAVKEKCLPMDQLGICAIDDNTLQVDLEHSTPNFLHTTVHWAYSPLYRDIDKMHPGWAHYGGEAYICNGPFRLAQWKRSNEMQVIKNPYYWDAENVKMMRIDISIIQDPETALRMYEQDELDWIGEPLTKIPYSCIAPWCKEGRVQQRAVAAVYWLEFSVEQFPFNSTKMRKAFAYAINRQQIIDKVLQSNEQPATSFLPPIMALQKEPYFKDGDVQKARWLFDEALFELGIRREELPRITLNYQDYEGEREVVEMICSQWGEAFGIKIYLEGFAKENYFERMLYKDFQVGSVTWHSWLKDPFYTLDYFSLTKGGINATRWENHHYTGLLNLAKQSTDLTKRQNALRQAEKLLIEEMPAIPIYYVTYKYLKKEQVKGIYLTDLGQIDFKWAYRQLN
jgi:ABC-type oligopeptide transport system substrate-binding subunit